MTDLFTCNLSSLSFHDVDQFLGLSLPEDKRLPESSQIDYKQELPPDLGEDVAALANTYGYLRWADLLGDQVGQESKQRSCGMGRGTTWLRFVSESLLSHPFLGAPATGIRHRRGAEHQWRHS